MTCPYCNGQYQLNVVQGSVHNCGASTCKWKCELACKSMGTADIATEETLFTNFTVDYATYFANFTNFTDSAAPSAPFSPPHR